MVAINLNPDFGYVVMVGAAMSLHCMLQGFAVGSARKKFKVDYPDMGCGRFSAKLTDKEWEEFNNVQRYRSILRFIVIGQWRAEGTPRQVYYKLLTK